LKATKGALVFIATILAVVGALKIIRAFVREKTRETVVTNCRISFAVWADAEKLGGILDPQRGSVFVDQSVLGRVFGYGNIRIRGGRQ
jgi:hypothetical protein